MPVPSRDPRVEAAYRHCERLARSHYENFPTASLLLPSRVRPAVAAVYAFARIADDFADEPQHAGHRAERLREHGARLDAALAGRADDPVFLAVADAVERFDLPASALHDLLSAFRQDVEVSRYENFDAVLDYCTRSADPVGRLVLALHGIRDAPRVRASDAICTGLQLTNFWQDVGIDLDKDRIYLPLDDRERFGVTEEQLFAKRATPEFRRLLAFEVERTRDVFAGGWPLVETTGGRLGAWLRLVWAGGHRILDLVERERFDVFEHRPVLRAWDWIGLAVPALAGRAAPRPVASRVGASKTGASGVDAA